MPSAYLKKLHQDTLLASSLDLLEADNAALAAAACPEAMAAMMCVLVRRA